MKHEIDLGKNNHTIITLHGTGGNARDLFELAKFLDPSATRIGFEGEVNENGMLRYFARFPDGSFDFESLALGTKNLKNSIDEVIDLYDLKNHKITVIGYSNGANIAVNLFKEYENVSLSNAILFHPSSMTPNREFKKQENLKVLISSGKNDPYISEEEFNRLTDLFINGGIDTEVFVHNQGHQLTQEELNVSKTFLDKNLKGA